TKTGVPEFRVKEAPSPWRSKVAPKALLNTAELLQVMDPFVHVPRPLLSKVPPCSVLPMLPLMLMAPFATKVKLDPATPKEPAVQRNNPPTCTVLLPVRV